MKLKSLLTGVLVLTLAFVFAQAAHAQSAASTANTTGTIMASPAAAVTATPAASSATTPATTGTTATTPGLPNTGAGGNAAVNFVVILASGLLVVGGTVYALREFAR